MGFPLIRKIVIPFPLDRQSAELALEARFISFFIKKDKEEEFLKMQLDGFGHDSVANRKSWFALLGLKNVEMKNDANKGSFTAVRLRIDFI